MKEDVSAGGLVLADTKAGPDDAEGRANRDRLIAFGQNNTARAVIDHMLPKLLGAGTTAQALQVVKEVRAIASRQTAAGIVGALQALRDRPDANPGLGAIAVPTLVLVGRDDTLTPPAKSEEMASRIPDWGGKPRGCRGPIRGAIAIAHMLAWLPN
jgi:pimeloyl-ACP methyl ester carboxylesterase